MKEILTFLLVLACHLTVHSQDELTAEDKLFGLSTIWQEANYNFAFFDQVPDLDWNQEYKKAIPKVLKTTTDKEYYLELQKFIAKLQDGHTQVYLPDHILKTQSNIKIRVKIEDNNYRVVDVARQLRKKIPIGSTITKINGFSINEYVAENVKPYLASSTEQGYNKLIQDYLFYGEIGETLDLGILNKGKEYQVDIVRNYEKYGDYINDFRDSLQPFEKATINNKIVVALNSFENDEIIDDFRAEIDKINQSEGLIIDLRNNVGGKAEVGLNIARYLIQGTQIVTLPWKSKHHIASHKAWGNSGLQLAGYENVNELKSFGDLNNWISITPDTLNVTSNIPKVKVPVKVLIDEDTASSAENFLAYIREESNIEIIGTPTFGSTGQPIYFSLPGNGYARICVKRNYLHDGTEIVGHGIDPQFFLSNTAEDLINKKDKQFQFAMERF